MADPDYKLRPPSWHLVLSRVTYAGCALSMLGIIVAFSALPQKSPAQMITGLGCTVILLAGIMTFFAAASVGMVHFLGVDDSLALFGTPRGKLLVFLTISGLGVGLGSWRIKQLRRDMDLPGEAERGTEFVMSPEGVFVCLGLLPGSRRADFRRFGRGGAHTTWDQIVARSVEAAAGGQNNRVPPRDRLRLKSGEQLVIMRERFRAREKELLDLARAFLHQPIQLMDDLLDRFSPHVSPDSFR